MILFLLLFTGILQAADLTVCATGCAYSNLQTALDAAARGDTVTLRAGQTFEGSFRLKRKAGEGVVTVRTSRRRSLPEIT